MDSAAAIEQLAQRIASDPAYLKGLMPRINKYMKQNPFTPKLHKKQAIFLMFNGLECLFGGGKGGGKSDVLLMAALQYVDCPGYGALILRRESPQLYKANALIPRAQSWLANTDARWKEQLRKFVFPSGATLEFGHMEHPSDRHIYDGSEYQFCCAGKTEVRMADGSWRRISNIKIGEYVETLDGIQRVTHVFNRGVKPCVNLRINGIDTVVSTDHKILTNHGWVCPTSPESIGFHGICNTQESSSPSPQESSEQHEGLRCCQKHSSEPWSQTQEETACPSPDASSADGQSDCKVSAGDILESQQPVLSSCLAMLYEPIAHRVESGKHLLSLEDVLYGEIFYPSTQDSLACCHSLSYCDDGLVRRYSVSCQAHIPLRVDALEYLLRHSREDGQEHIHDSILVESGRHRHPYTNQPMCGVSEFCFADIEISLADAQEVFDLRVSCSSHYITRGGIINMNCGFDQVEQFEEEMYLHAFSLVRRTNASSHIPIRIRSTANPVGAHSDWVRRRFIREPIPGERVFIPSLLKDNPYLDQSEYEKAMSYLPELVRKQLLHGDWDAEALGAVFDKNWFKQVETVPVDNEFVHRVRWWDLAATTSAQNTDADYTAGALLGITPDGTVWILDLHRVRCSAADVENLIQNVAKIDGRDVTIWMNQDPGQAGKAQAAHYTELLRGYDFHTEPATGPKLTAWRPFAAYAENGKVMVARRRWTDDLMDELCRVTGTNKSEHDDQTDAVSRAFLKLEMPTAVRTGLDLMRKQDYEELNPNVFKDWD